MEYVTRAEWGAREAEPDMSAMPKATVRKIVAHHTAEPPPTDPAGAHDEAHDAAAGQVRAIQAVHMDTRGFSDIAYHWLIAPDGALYEGRAMVWVGAHAGPECNPGSIGVATLSTDTLTDHAKSAFLELRAWLTQQGYDVAEVEPHSSCNATSCPGDEWRAWIAAGLPVPAHAPPPPPPAEPGSECSQLAPGAPPAGWPLLRLGSTGHVVAYVQKRLNELGHHPANSWRANGWDGIFGPGTAAAVRDLQQAEGLQADGVVGRQTYCALGIR